MMKFVKKNKGLVFALVAVFVTLGLNMMLSFESLFVERFYSMGLFSFFRSLWDFTVGWSPVPLIYVLLIIIVCYLSSVLFVRKGWLNRSSLLLKRIIITICLLITSFYWMWGFNYKRLDIREKLGLADVSVDVDDVFIAYQMVSDSLNSLRSNLPNQISWADYGVDQDQLRQDLMRMYSTLGLNTSGHVRIRMLYPKGSLLYTSTAGIYLPFVGEGHIDPGLHPLTHPFTMMHEMSHGYGWTGEDVCNFLALLGAVNSKNNITRYSGYLGYWRYLRSSAYYSDKVRWQSLGVLINERVQCDYEGVVAYSDRYPDIMPRLRDLIYDQYLKSHGISEGIISYSEMIKLAHAWKEKHGSLFLPAVE